jgi:uncharacterized protein with PIN domain
VKFVTDGMFGKLTRWLRILGYDVKYSASGDDEQLIKIAKTENRVLLTRDFNLYRLAKKRAADAFFVEGSTKAEELADLTKHYDLNLEIDVNLSRCPKCNQKITPVPKNELIDRLPETTYLVFDEFWKCPGCGQIYWQGAHWKRINKTLSDARKKTAIA